MPNQPPKRRRIETNMDLQDPKPDTSKESVRLLDKSAESKSSSEKKSLINQKISKAIEKAKAKRIEKATPKPSNKGKSGNYPVKCPIVGCGYIVQYVSKSAQKALIRGG